MYIKSISSDCGANKWVISAFFTCTTGMKNENKKNQKKFSDNNFHSKAKIFRKNFLKRQRSIRHPKGGCGLSFAPIQKTENNTRAARSYRIYILRFAAFGAPCALLFARAVYLPSR